MTVNKRFPHDLSPGILALYYSLRDDSMGGNGSAFLIGAMGNEGLALTAAHVFTDFDRMAAQNTPFKNLRDVRLANPRFESFVSHVIGERECNGESDKVFVTGYSAEPDKVDIAVATVISTPDSPPLQGFKLKLAPPEAGERVIVAGYSGFDELADAPSGQPGARAFSYVAQSAHARVVSDEARMPNVCPGPSFEIDYQVESAMSGAPVFCLRNGRYYACGVVASSGYERTVVAALWPILGLQIEVRASDGNRANEPLVRLIKQGIIGVYEPDLRQFEVDTLDDGSVNVRWLACPVAA